jgi:hypothetical protein
MRDKYPEGSPPFRVTNSSTVAAGDFFIYNFELSDRAAAAYVPFNDLVITNNNSSNAVKLIIDGGRLTYLIPASVTKHFDKKALAAFSAIQLENVGSGNISAGELEIVAQLAPIDGDNVIQGLTPLLGGR